VVIAARDDDAVWITSEGATAGYTYVNQSSFHALTKFHFRTRPESKLFVGKHLALGKSLPTAARDMQMDRMCESAGDQFLTPNSERQSCFR
jgi:hypothetical protein